MERRLQYSRIQMGMFEDGRAKLDVVFLDA